MALGFGVYTIAIALISIMLSIAGMILGLGYAIDDRKLKEFGKSEIYQSVINGAIVGILIIAFGSGGFFTLLINNITGGAAITATCEQAMSSNYAICFAYNYLVGLQPVGINGANYPTLIDTSVGLLAPVSVLYTSLSLLGSIKLSLGVISIGFYSALNPILTALNYIIEILTAAIISIEVQGILLKFISIIAIPVLLPVGILLRTVYVTRKLGGAVMAIAIGLYAVFPLTYVLDASLANSYITSLSSGSVSTFIASETNSNNNIISMTTQISESNKNDTFGFVSYFTNAINNLVKGFDGFLNQLTSMVALIIIEVFFLPVFSLILTVISIRELANILGSEISFGKLYIF
ncbi:MAG: hypothetical protein KGI06_04795 [Candidatus Micrarchaeota archaeon]|nr:hypothetical protein [Candidatus Micrarchaeota archaeon]